MRDYRSPAMPDEGGWATSLAQSATASGLVGVPTVVYFRNPLRVLSSRMQAEYRGLVCPHNHVSVSVDPSLGRRPTDDEMDEVRHDFDMHDAEEDNHQRGQIRNLFLPLHLPRGTVGICDCKANEEQVVEPDGFVWSKERDQ